MPAYDRDWETEVADPDRVVEFLDAYEDLSLDDNEKFARMSLIVAPFDVLLAQGHDQSGHWQRVRRHLLGRFDLHGYTVQYWSLPDEDDGAACRERWEFTPHFRHDFRQRLGDYAWADHTALLRTGSKVSQPRTGLTPCQSRVLNATTVPCLQARIVEVVIQYRRET